MHAVAHSHVEGSAGCWAQKRLCCGERRQAAVVGRAAAGGLAHPSSREQCAGSHKRVAGAAGGRVEAMGPPAWEAGLKEQGWGRSLSLQPRTLRTIFPSAAQATPCRAVEVEARQTPGSSCLGQVGSNPHPQEPTRAPLAATTGPQARLRRRATAQPPCSSQLEPRALRPASWQQPQSSR